MKSRLWRTVALNALAVAALGLLGCRDPDYREAKQDVARANRDTALPSGDTSNTGQPTSASSSSQMDSARAAQTEVNPADLPPADRQPSSAVAGNNSALGTGGSGVDGSDAGVAADAGTRHGKKKQ